MHILAPILFPLYVTAYVVIAAVIFQQYRRTRDLIDLVLGLLLLSVAYDNLILALGRVLANAPALFVVLSRFRYIFHGTFMPYFAVVALGLLERTATTPRPRLMRGVWIAATVLAVVGLVASALLILADPPVMVAGVLRIPPDRDASAAWTRRVPHLSTVLATVIMIIVGGILWRRVGWPWLFAVSVLTFVVAAAFHGERAFILMNFVEVLLGAGLVATSQRLAKHT